jgi:hypothetical protein
MTTATKHIIVAEGQPVDDFEFSLAYLPMNTGDDFIASTVAVAIAPVLISYIIDSIRVLVRGI